MAQQGARAQQAGPGVDLGVVRAIREQLLDPGQFLQVLAEVGLHVGAGPLREAPGPGQQGRGAGGGVARGEGILQAAAIPAMPGLAEVQTLGERRLGSLQQAGRGEAVHHDLAQDGADAAAFGFQEGVVGGLGVHGAVDRGGGGAQGQLVPEIAARGPGGQLGVLEPELGGEDVGLQPGQQGQAVQGHGLVLGQMGVQVDQARQDPAGAQILDGRPGMGRGHRLEGAGGLDAALGVHHQGAVGQVQELGGAQGAQQVGAVEDHLSGPARSGAGRSPGRGPFRRPGRCSVRSPATPAPGR